MYKRTIFMVKRRGFTYGSFCVAIIVATLGLLALAGCQSDTGDFPMNDAMNPTEETTIPVTQALGRFTVTLPTGMTLADPPNRWQSGPVTIREVAWPAAPNKEKARILLWQQHMKALYTKARGYPEQAPTIEEQTYDEQTPWRRESLYYDHAGVPYITWDILVDAGDYAVWFKINGLEKSKDLMQNILTNVYQHYVSEAQLSKTTFQAGLFYVDKGAVQLAFDNRESVYVWLHHDTYPDLVLTIEMQTAMSDEGISSILGEVPDMKKEAKELNIQFKVLRAQQRNIHGLAGEELLVIAKQADNESALPLSFHWEYGGEFRSPDKPYITIDMEASDSDVKEKMAIWDQLLDSLQYIGE